MILPGLLGPLGDFRSDIIDALDYIPGVSKSKAEGWISSAEEHIRAQAKAGALQAVPTIERKIKTPLIAALALGGAGVLFGGWALVRSFRR